MQVFIYFEEKAAEVLAHVRRGFVGRMKLWELISAQKLWLFVQYSVATLFFARFIKLVWFDLLLSNKLLKIKTLSPRNEWTCQLVMKSHLIWEWKQMQLLRKKFIVLSLGLTIW